MFCLVILNFLVISSGSEKSPILKQEISPVGRNDMAKLGRNTRHEYVHLHKDQYLEKSIVACSGPLAREQVKSAGRVKHREEFSAKIAFILSLVQYLLRKYGGKMDEYQIDIDGESKLM